MGILSRTLAFMGGVLGGAMDGRENDVLVVPVPSDSLGCLVVVYPTGLLPFMADLSVQLGCLRAMATISRVFVGDDSISSFEKAVLTKIRYLCLWYRKSG